MNFKYLICAFIGCVMSHTAFAKDVYVVTSCGASGLTAAQKTFCTSTTNMHQCSSSSSSVVPNGTYYACGTFSITSQSSKYILCFKAQTDCEYYLSCGADYYTTTPPTVTLSSLATGAGGVTNDAQFSCCKSCGPGAWSDVSGQNYQQRNKRQCTTTGTCSNINQSVAIQRRCKAGYYNSSGAGIVTYGDAITCTSCATATSNTKSTSAAGAYAITQCYVPSSVSQTDAKGTFEYTSNCYYSN